MYLKTVKVTWLSEEKTKLGRLKHRWRTRKMYNLKCDGCGSEFQREAKGFSSKRASNDYKHYCDECDGFRLAQQDSRTARIENLRAKVGEKHVDSLGYVSVYVGDTHPYSEGYCGSIREHIMVMENHLGRKLKKGEIVHHIDGDKTNNDIDNLDICTVQEHNACHANSEEVVFELYKKELVGYDRVTKRYYVI